MSPPEPTTPSAADHVHNGEDSTAVEHGHTGASVRTYLIIGIVLAVFTMIEVQLPNLLANDRPLLVVSLVVTAFVKAAFVVLYYMHLKFDSRIYSGIVLLALVLISYFLILLLV